MDGNNNNNNNIIIIVIIIIIIVFCNGNHLRSFAVLLKRWGRKDLNRSWTLTSAMPVKRGVFCRLSCQASWELVIVWVNDYWSACRRRCTKPACWALFCMPAKHGLYTHTKSEMPSTCAISDEASCFRQACQACLPSSPRDTRAGSGTCAEWKMAASPRTSRYEELITGKWPTGRPTLCDKDVSARRTNRAWGIDFASNQMAIKDQGWRQIVGGVRRENQWEEKRICKWQRLQSSSAAATISTTAAWLHLRQVPSHLRNSIGLHSCNRRCTSS